MSKTFEGKPCGKCGSTTRYTSNKHCVACQVACYEANREVWRSRSMLANAKSRARKQGLEFTLTIEDIEDMFAESQGKCPIRGVPFTLGGNMNANSATLDRLTPDEGYTLENCAVISRRANMIKSDVTEPKELYQVADWLREKLKHKPRNTNGNNEC